MNKNEFFVSIMISFWQSSFDKVIYFFVPTEYKKYNLPEGYDAYWANTFTEKDGKLAITNEIVVFLIYEEDGKVFLKIDEKPMELKRFDSKERKFFLEHPVFGEVIFSNREDLLKH